MLGATVPVLVEGTSKRDESHRLAGKSPEEPNRPRARRPQGVTPSELAGTFVNVKIDDAKTSCLVATCWARTSVSKRHRIDETGTIGHQPSAYPHPSSPSWGPTASGKTDAAQLARRSASAGKW